MIEQHVMYVKMTGETPEVRSDKRRQIEKREEREEREKERKDKKEREKREREKRKIIAHYHYKSSCRS